MSLKSVHIYSALDGQIALQLASALREIGPQSDYLAKVWRGAPVSILTLALTCFGLRQNGMLRGGLIPRRYLVSLRLFKANLWLLLASIAVGVLSAASSPCQTNGVKVDYLVSPLLIGKTPKYLGTNVEVMEYADRSNLWDWLADSGAGMVRVFHPNVNLLARPALESDYASILTRKDFDVFREHLIHNPERNVPWSHYRFAQEIPWVGTPDLIVDKLEALRVQPILSMSYRPTDFPRPLLKELAGTPQPGDSYINWDAAASAYEYYLAVIYHYSTRNHVLYYMMLNEPGDAEKTVEQVGVLARLARLALEDVKGAIQDKQTADRMRLSGPAVYAVWEKYWPYVSPYVDFLDAHLYDPDAYILQRKAQRIAMVAQLSGKRWGVSEFNRIGGRTAPEQSLFNIKPSLELSGLLMSTLSDTSVTDPEEEFALLYEFQFPAVQRNFKSLVYGDMNLVDWTGQDIALRSRDQSMHPSFEELQLRFPTPAFDIFKMFARAVPNGRTSTDTYDVLRVGEGDRENSGLHDPVDGRLAFPALEPEKYYALKGGGFDLRVVAVRGDGKLFIFALNPGPSILKNIGFNISLLKEGYGTAIVRETSLGHRDEAILQIAPLSRDIVIDISPESLTQIILVKENLHAVGGLRLEEATATPGTIGALHLFETTRLHAYGMVEGQWEDLSSLNVKWSSSNADLIRVDQTGLVQRLRNANDTVKVTAETLDGAAVVDCTIPPVSPNQ